MTESTTERVPSRGLYFDYLNLIRGIAALLVLIYHVDFMFGLRGQLLPAGYLAVDLFFILSGFVLSLTYGPRIQQGTIDFRGYLVARLARLYPLFLVTTLAGVVVMTARFEANSGYVDTLPLSASAIANVLMIPTFAAPYATKTAFVFNPASWSIFFEMIVSILFFLSLARLPNAGLVLVLIVSGILAALSIFAVGTVDVGYATDNLIYALPRVVYSFTVGILIQRAFAKSAWTCRAGAAYALLLLVILMMQLKLWLPQQPYFDLVALMVVLPMLVIAGAGVTLRGASRKIASLLGQASYGVYLIQGTLIIAAAGASQKLLGRKIYDLSPWVGFAFVAFTLALSLLVAEYFEYPARRYLKQWAARVPRKRRIPSSAEKLRVQEAVRAREKAAGTENLARSRTLG
jgi:peptidoglycan/LPS O-acetylase OafA/YrhL